MYTPQSSLEHQAPYTLFSLPGFLGQPNDWKSVLSSNHLWQHIPLHYYGSQLPSPTAGLRAWGDAFNRLIVSRAAHNRLLLGYSLGGRLALHALCRAPQQWNAAVIISAHPGLPAEERAVRLHNDEVWAQRFEREPLEQVLQAWNQQKLFNGAPFPAQRSADSYDRSLIAATLRSWSLSRQQDMSKQLAELDCPILWLAGDCDSRYNVLASTVRFKNPLSRVIVVPECGHRLPWEQPQLFLSAIEDFVCQLQASTQTHSAV
jgi:2-succinyl-6-hydroxy-2,4-cyclohexadiene-1-carboxylate synthase